MKYTFVIRLFLKVKSLEILTRVINITLNFLTLSTFWKSGGKIVLYQPLRTSKFTMNNFT